MKTSVKINLFAILFISSLLSGCAVFSKLGTSPYEGKWSYSLDTGEDVFKGFLTLMKDGEIYTGTVSTQDMTTDLKDLKIENGKLTANLDAEGYPLNIKGEFKDEVFFGSLIGPDFTFSFNAYKVKE